jgi:Na+/H+ antiporter NhaD/arsenite permease-like protein
MPVEFVLFAAILAGVAFFHHRALRIAAGGVVAIALYKTFAGGFSFFAHLAHEWVIIVNLLGLLLGFAVLARHFEFSAAPAVVPKFLPDSWTGGLVLLLLVFVGSGFLDNIASALIGGTIACAVYQSRVTIGCVVAIFAAANAGGAGSVIGDTTTTMLRIGGVSALSVAPAYLAAFVALMVLGLPAALAQHRHQPIAADPPAGIRVDWTRVGVVGVLLLSLAGTNLALHPVAPRAADYFPALGVAIWVAISLTTPFRKPDWSVIPEAMRGAVFLLSLVVCASTSLPETGPQAQPRPRSRTRASIRRIRPRRPR